MTDKQIIINGCDVSGCRYAEPTATTPKCAINDWIHCDGHNCYYKQLRRKEQECEELKENLPNAITRLMGELDQLKATNEDLKKQLMQKNEVDMFFNTPIKGWSNDPCEICPHKAENEQLKEELSVIQHNCNREGCKYYDDDTFKVFYECKAQKALQLSANSVTTKYCDLLQTLTEIRKIASKVLLNTHDLEQFKDADALFGALLEIHKKIGEVE